MRRLVAIGLMAAIAAGCRGSSQQQGDAAAGQAGQAESPPESEAPVALNPDVPIAYPPALYEQKVEADVVLRLFVDSTGKLVPESTRVAEPSGYAALDSAAVNGAAALRFAPAKRHGVAVATAFLQPVEFRQVGTIRTGTVTLPPGGTPPAAPPPNPPASPPPAPPAARPRPRPPVVRDTTRADTTARPAPPPPPPPPPDTTKARTDTSATAH